MVFGIYHNPDFWNGPIWDNVSNPLLESWRNSFTERILNADNYQNVNNITLEGVNELSDSTKYLTTYAQDVLDGTSSLNGAKVIMDDYNVRLSTYVLPITSEVYYFDRLVSPIMIDSQFADQTEINRTLRHHSEPNLKTGSFSHHGHNFVYSDENSYYFSMFNPYISGLNEIKVIIDHMFAIVDTSMVSMTMSMISYNPNTEIIGLFSLGVETNQNGVYNKKINFNCSENVKSMTWLIDVMWMLFFIMIILNSLFLISVVMKILMKTFDGFRERSMKR